MVDDRESARGRMARSSPRNKFTEENAMSKRDDDKNEAQPGGPAGRDKLNKPAATHEHRLRGDDDASDFVDADADSSAATSRRVDKQSDS